jgi:hypothetical protein
MFFDLVEVSLSFDFDRVFLRSHPYVFCEVMIVANFLVLLDGMIPFRE